MIKKKKLFVAIMLTFALCFASISSAFAAQAPNGENGTTGDPVIAAGGVGAIVSDTPGTSVTAYITKVLQMPVGTTAPTATFKFTATPESVDGDTSVKPPVLNSGNQFSVAYPGGTAATADTNTATYTQETGNIFAGVNFPHAGIYVYTITETAGTYTTATGEVMVYSPASYKLYAFVANDGNGGLYIQAVSDVVTTIDNSNQKTDYKVDPSLGEHGMVFTNTFMRTHQGTITNPNLEVSKTVTGSYADLTKYFPYTMTVTAPDVSYDPSGNLPASSVTTASPVPFTATAPTYQAYILDASGAIITDPTPNSI